MVSHVQHAGAVMVLEYISKEHSTVQEVVRAEMMSFGGGGGKVHELKGV